MSENYVILNNPLIFMNDSYLKKVLEGKYSTVTYSIISLNEIPAKIFFIFKDNNLCDSFISDYNDKYFDDKMDYKLNLEKTDKNPDELNTLLQKEITKLIPYTYQKSYQNEWRINYSNTIEKNGLLFLNEEEKQLGYKAVKYLITKFGQNLLQGKNVLNISLPVFMFDKRTLHEAFVWEQVYCPYFVTKAVFAKDKIEKLKWLTTYLVSKFHLSVIQLKPFNPIIGETFQCRIGDIDIYLEHTVNHPITANFYAKEINGNYKMYGYQITEASTNLNSVTAMRYGKFFIELKDKTKYRVFIPDVILRGISMGDRLFNFIGTGCVVDLTNNLCAFLEMNPDQPGFFSSFFTKKKTFPDHIRGKICDLKYVTIDEKNNNHQLSKDSNSYSEIEGEWTSSLSFDGVEYWNIDDYKAFKIFTHDFILPSNGTQRDDLKKLIEGNEEESQVEKEKLEVRQRKDRKLRADYMNNKKK